MSQFLRTIGIDPGNQHCGIVVLDGGKIISAFNIISDNLCNKLTHFLIHSNCTVVVEDIRPYSLRLTPQVIDTCKFIGEAVYRLRNEAGANVELMSRFEVKRWVFETFPHIALPLIRKKIEKKDQRTSSGQFRTPTMMYVDDKIVMEAMKFHYRIPLPPPGAGYMYGLKEHSWQALALASLHQSGSH